MESLRKWVEESPYTAALGTRLEKAGEDHAEILLPYQESNSNPGGALHGGCAATLAAGEEFPFAAPACITQKMGEANRSRMRGFVTASMYDPPADEHRGR